MRAPLVGHGAPGDVVAPLPGATAPGRGLLAAPESAATPLQVDATGGGPFALLVTFLLATLFYAVTLHLAALYFLGDVPSQRAAYAAPVPAAVSLLLQRYGPAVVVPVTLVGDFLAVSFSYRLRARTAAVLTLLHFAIAVVLGLALSNIFGFV